MSAPDQRKKPVAQPKPAARCRNGDPCDGCADACGRECTCDCHWQDTNIMPPDWYDARVIATGGER